MSVWVTICPLFIVNYTLNVPNFRQTISVGSEPKLGSAQLGFGSRFWAKKLGLARLAMPSKKLGSARLAISCKKSFVQRGLLIIYKVELP